MENRNALRTFGTFFSNTYKNVDNIISHSNIGVSAFVALVVVVVVVVVVAVIV